MSILKTTDFQSGKTRISQDQYSTADLEAFIGDQENYGRIKHIFGATLGQELIDDLAGDPAEPQTAKWITLFSEFNYNFDDVPVYCIGLKEVLKRLCYYDYVLQQAEQNQMNGNQVAQSEASSAASFQLKAVRIYNEAVNGIRQLQLYVSDNSDTFSDYDGFYFEFEGVL